MGRFDVFRDPDSRHLAVLFAVVYFAQGMWSLPVQSLTLHFKEQGYGAAETANFFLLGTIPWVLKPAYGLLSDTVPLLGWRRKSYFLLMSGLAAAAAFGIAAGRPGRFGTLAAPYFAMSLGLAFTDVLTDALMVEEGKPRGLTGAFQSMQWAAISLALLLTGVLGGWYAQHRSPARAFLVTGLFPVVSCTMGALFIREPRRREPEREAFHRAWTAVRGAARSRNLWLVAAFIFFFNFSPSFGPAFLYYQTDRLHFGQEFIGWMDSLMALTGALGALIYAPLSRRVPLRRLIVASIGASVAGTLAYLAYLGHASAVVISAVFGCVGMIVRLAFLDLAAKACPRSAEGTFFALLMAVNNGSVQLSTNVGGLLYDHLGYRPLVFVSAAATALAWVFVPFVPIDAIVREAEAA
jgi:MFS family permease